MAAPTPPRAVRVGAYTYRVVVGGREFTRQETEELPDGTGFMYGRCDNPGGVIVLRDGMAHDVTADTLLHELLHACYFTVGQPLKTETEERAIAFVSATLLQVLRDNPGLVEYLTASAG